MLLQPGTLVAQEPARPSDPPPATGAPAAADKPADPTAQRPAPTIEELQRQIDALAAEVEQLRSGEEPDKPLSADERRRLGLAPSAAALYRRKAGVSFAGYGEMLYENFDADVESGPSAPRTSRLDYLRAVMYAGYRFTDRFLFNSEIEYEHGGEELAIEFAYLDYLASPHVAIRAGMVLVPMGLINEFHESNVYLGARRPETERRIIPSTWHENGAGILGGAGRVTYRAYLVNGLDARGFAASGLRGGRQGGAEALAADLGIVGRLDVTAWPGVFFGGSVYTGGADQGQIVVDGQAIDVATTIAEVHGQGQWRGWDLRGLFAAASVGNAEDLNAALRLPASAGVAAAMRGGYAQVGYNALSQTSATWGLTPYYRFEHLDTQAEPAAGYAADPSQSQTFHTLGVEFRPIYNIVVKADYQWVRNDAGTGRNQFNLNLGYAF